MFDPIQQAYFQADNFVWPSNDVIDVQMALGRNKVPHPPDLEQSQETRGRRGNEEQGPRKGQESKL